MSRSWTPEGSGVGSEAGAAGAGRLAWMRLGPVRSFGAGDAPVESPPCARGRTAGSGSDALGADSHPATVAAIAASTGNDARTDRKMLARNGLWGMIVQACDSRRLKISPRS